MMVIRVKVSVNLLLGLELGLGVSPHISWFLEKRSSGGQLASLHCSDKESPRCLTCQPKALQS